MEQSDTANQLPDCAQLLNPQFYVVERLLAETHFKKRERVVKHPLFGT